ncbi:MAG: AAA family ATPase [Acidobacteria bacterium]|nr:AAA family ATPase [Acidobacteriota bacterium]
MDKAALDRTWQRQAKTLGFSAAKVRANARKAERGLLGPDLFAGPGYAAGDAAAWAVAHISERQAVFGHADLLAATLAREPGAITVDAAERAIAALERDGALHAARGLDHGRHWSTDAALARESETIALMRAGQGAEKTVMRRWVAETKLHRGRLNEGQKEAVKTILAGKDRVVAVQGYAGTGKTTMLKRLRALAASQGYRTVGLAPSASAAKTLQNEAGIESETLQRYLARHDGIAHGRGTAAGLRKLRAANAKTMLVVDESSLASSEQVRNLLRIATALRLPRVVLVGDEKQLGAVEAGKPFEQLKAAGMQTAVMDDIVRQRDAELKAAVKASLTGDVKGAFAKLGDNIRQVEYGEVGAETARRWLNLPRDLREATGVIAPTRALRDSINATIREGLVAEGAISGPARQGEKLVARDLTRAQMARASNYAAGDTVIFARPYKTLGVEKGDERRVARFIHNGHTVVLADAKGNETEWKPYLLAGAKGGVEVFKGEAIELRRGDRVRFTRNDPASGLTNGETATVESVERGGVLFRLDDGKIAKLNDGDAQLRHIDRAFAATVHAFQGRTVDRIVAAMPAGNPKLTDQRAFYVAISRARDTAQLVTDDAHKLADQLQRATGERLAALDATAKQAAWETVFERGAGPDRGGDRVTRASDAMDKGLEPNRQGGRGHPSRDGIERESARGRGREHRIEREADRDRDGKPRDRSAGRERAGRDSGKLDREIDRGGERQQRAARQSEQEKAAEPKQKSRDFDMGL